MIDAAVLTISDSVDAGTRADVSGPAVRQRLEQLGWRVSVTEVIPDDAALIGRRLAALADSHSVAAIFTTGGTGVALRDVTPEATRAILHKEIPGLGELMRARGSRSTPMAALSRAIGGTRGDVLIVSRLDRLARSTRDLLDILDTLATRGASFRSLGDPWADTTAPHGRLMLTVLGGLAEFERELIRVRTGDGRALACS